MVIVGLSLEKKEYLIRFQIIYNSIKNEEYIMATKTITNKFENHLISIRAERQQKIIELIDWILDKYKTAVNTQKMNQQVITDNIIEELDNKREVVINKKQKTLLKDETLKYSKEEDTIDMFFS